LSSLEVLKDYMEVAKRVKGIVQTIDPNAKVYVFGSAVSGRLTASSDIDILVITSKIDEKYRMIVKVYKNVNAPVELHVVTGELYENWYRRFIPQEEIKEV